MNIAKKAKPDYSFSKQVAADLNLPLAKVGVNGIRNNLPAHEFYKFFAQQEPSIVSARSKLARELHGNFPMTVRIWCDVLELEKLGMGYSAERLAKPVYPQKWPVGVKVLYPNNKKIDAMLPEETGFEVNKESGDIENGEGSGNVYFKSKIAKKNGITCWEIKIDSFNFPEEAFYQLVQKSENSGDPLISLLPQADDGCIFSLDRFAGRVDAKFKHPMLVIPITRDSFPIQNANDSIH